MGGLWYMYVVEGALAGRDGERAVGCGLWYVGWEVR